MTTGRQVPVTIGAQDEVAGHGGGKDRLNSVDIFRLICAMLVVAIHTHPFTDINPYLGYFASEILPRIAVPFFFSISGYYYLRRMERATSRAEMMKILRVTLLRYLKVYCFWSVVFFAFDYQYYVYPEMTLKGFMANILSYFFVYGAYYHLWYFLGIFFSLLVVTFFYLMKAEKVLAYMTLGLYGIGLLGCAYYGVGNVIPGIDILINSANFTVIRRIVFMALPFFTLGYFLPYFPKRHLSSKLIVCLGLYLAEIAVVNVLKLNDNIILTILLYPLLAFVLLWLFQHPLPDMKMVGKHCKYLSGFVYFCHPLFILMLLSMGISGNTVQFFLTNILSLAVGVLFMKANIKVLN